MRSVLRVVASSSVVLLWDRTAGFEMYQVKVWSKEDLVFEGDSPHSREQLSRSCGLMRLVGFCCKEMAHQTATKLK